jgi:hypothetical protein
VVINFQFPNFGTVSTMKQNYKITPNYVLFRSWKKPRHLEKCKSKFFLHVLGIVFLSQYLSVVNLAVVIFLSYLKVKCNFNFITGHLNI